MSELPPGWANARLADLGAWCGGGTPSKSRSDFWSNGSIPWVSPKDMKVSLIADAEDHITEAAVVGSATNVVPAGSVLVVVRSGILRRIFPVAVTTSAVALNQDLKALKPAGGIDPRYVAWFLRGDEHSILRECAKDGTTVDSIDFPALLRRVIPVAPSAEQERIVATIEEQFSRLDAGVAALGRVRQNLQRMRAVAFALIADSVDAWRPLGEIAEVVGGVTKDAKRQSDPSFVEVPYLRVANVQRGYLDLAAVTTIRVPAATVDKLRLEPGDILFNEGGDRDKLGRGWIWEGQIKDCIHQNHVFRARLRTDEFESKFISMHGNTFGRTWFEKMGKQTTNLASLNLTTLKSFPVPDLPVERQRDLVAEIERQLSLLDSLQSVVDHSLMRCRLLRSSILASAFSGRLVTQDPVDEPASILLKRIAAEQKSPNGRKVTPTRKRRTSREQART